MGWAQWDQVIGGAFPAGDSIPLRTANRSGAAKPYDVWSKAWEERPSPPEPHTKNRGAIPEFQPWQPLDMGPTF